MNRPVHFEILSDDPQKSADFYASTFGWKVNTWTGGQQSYWLVDTGSDGAGINGGIMHRHFEQSVINTVEVESLEATLRMVEAGGGRKVHGPNEITGVGTVAYCADPQGTIFGVLEPAAG